MRLDRARITNFRSIKDLEIESFRQAQFLVGMNECGKSNILAALSQLNENSFHGEANVREALSDEDPNQRALVSFELSLSETEVQDALKRLRPFVRGDIDDLLQRDGKPISFVSAIPRIFLDVDARTGSRAWRVDELDPKIEFIPGWMHLKPTQSTQVQAQAQVPEVRPFAGKIHRVVDVGGVQTRSTELTNNHLKALISFFISKRTPPACIPWKFSEATEFPSRVEISKFVENPSSYEPVRTMFRLAGFTDPGGSLADAAKTSPQRIRNVLQRVARATNEHIRKAWPEINGAEIVLAPNGEFVDISVKDFDSHFSVNQRSDGFRRLLAFILQVSAPSEVDPDRSTVYLLDEPDLGLHPSGIRFLRDELIRLGERSPVVASTHSIFMIDRSNIGRHLLVSKSQEVTTAKVAGYSAIADEEVVYQALNFSLLDLLENWVIVFEGWKDKRLFDLFRLKSLGSESSPNELAKIGRCFSKGVKDAPKTASLLDRNGRQVLIVSDGDPVAREVQREYGGAGNWRRYDEFSGLNGLETAEDFIVPEYSRAIFEDVARGRVDVSLLGEFDFSARGLVRRLRAQLVAAGVSADEAKKLVGEWKEAIFVHLSADSIRDDYASVIREICSFFREKSGVVA